MNSEVMSSVLYSRGRRSVTCGGGVKREPRLGVEPAHLVCGQSVPNLIPLRAVVSLIDELFQHSPSNTRAIQSNVLSSSFEVHDLKFASGVTVVGLLCGDRKRRMVSRPGSCDARDAVLGYIRNIAGGSWVLVGGGFWRGDGGGCGEG